MQDRGRNRSEQALITVSFNGYNVPAINQAEAENSFY